MNFSDISKGSNTAPCGVSPFHEFRPAEKVVGPFRIWELTDDRNWAYNYHWKRPTQDLNPVGCYNVRNLVVTRPGSNILNTNLVYDCATGFDNQRSIPQEDDYFLQSQKNKIVIDEPVVIGDGVSFDVWGHWLIDYLPRFAVAKATIGEQFSKTKILLPHSSPQWVYRFLEFALGVRRENIINYNPGSDIVLCREAILPSYCYTNEFSFHSFVRDFYTSLTPSSGSEKKTRKILCPDPIFFTATDSSPAAPFSRKWLWIGDMKSSIRKNSLLRSRSGSSPKLRLLLESMAPVCTAPFFHPLAPS